MCVSQGMWLKGRWGQKLQRKMSIYRTVYGNYGHTTCSVYVKISCSFLFHYHHSPVNVRVERRGWAGGISRDLRVGNGHKKQEKEQGELALSGSVGVVGLSLNLHPFQRPVEKQSLLFKCLQPR